MERLGTHTPNDTLLSTSEQQLTHHGGTYVRELHLLLTFVSFLVL